MALNNNQMNCSKRKTSPKIISKLWQCLETDSVSKSSNEQQFKNSLTNELIEKIAIYENECQLIIDNAIEDKLIVGDNSYSYLRYKPSFDRSVFGQLTNDWYCCECHSCKAEELLTNCKTCFRAFHMNCIKEWTIDENNIECNYCLKLQQLDKSLRINCIERQFLNKLLKLLLKCLEEYMGFDICKYFSCSEDNKKAKVLLFKDMDLRIIDYKTKIYSYFSVQQFENDFKHFVHNYIVLNPENSMTEYKRLMKIMKHFNQELSELKLCVDCYNYSNSDEFRRSDDRYEWFTHVCDPPHRLVDAKLKNYPFWPSKVITVSDDQQKYDVRFFDPPMFKRATIPLHRLRPIQYKSKKKRLIKPIQILQNHCKKLREKGFNV